MPTTKKELQQRDLGGELLESVRQMKAGRAGKVYKVGSNIGRVSAASIKNIFRP